MGASNCCLVDLSHGFYVPWMCEVDRFDEAKKYFD
jgi:hypothetical protein